jgi:hypothetical protein
VAQYHDHDIAPPDSSIAQRLSDRQGVGVELPRRDDLLAAVLVYEDNRRCIGLAPSSVGHRFE